MRKLLSLVLSICLLSGVCNFSVYASDSADISGTVLTKNQAITAFETGSIGSSRSVNTAVIKVNQTSIVDENIIISGNVCVGNESKPFNLNGKLYKSIMQQKGVDAYSGKLKDNTGNFEVLHFFIKKDTDFYQYVLDNSLRNKKMFLLYLRDSNGNVLAFENELDSLNLSSNSVIEADEVADSSDDILWFGKVIPGEYTETEKPVNRTLYDDVVYTPVIQRNSTYYGQAWNENANGKVWMYIGDVPTAGDATFQTALKLNLYILMEYIKETVQILQYTRIPRFH